MNFYTEYFDFFKKLIKRRNSLIDNKCSKNFLTSDEVGDLYTKLDNTENENQLAKFIINNYNAICMLPPANNTKTIIEITEIHKKACLILDPSGYMALRLGHDLEL